MAKDLLLEIGTEEIPAKFIPGALRDLKEIAAAKLDERRITYSEVKTYGTPRRMTLMVRDIAEKQSDRESENKGPSLKIAFDDKGAPTKAAQGFARGQGVEVNQLIEKDGYVYAIVNEFGREVQDILPELLPEIITSLNFPKSMRWGELDFKFVRPIRWLVALYSNQVISFELANVKSGQISYGHRFLSKGQITIKSVDEYFAKMTESHVMVDQDLRRRIIREQVEKLALQQGGKAVIDEELLEEVTYLVEYPTALCGKFEEKYLALPPEAIITPMREHQRYFPVFDGMDKLLPVFITVRNGGQDGIDIVRHGNERVLKARLDDARFFFEEDKKVSLEARVEKLKTVVYQEGLGTMFDKVQRVEQLAVFIAKEIGASEAELLTISRGAFLSKADLVTGMVCEFTELQGVMGREYALLSGESPAVAQTIYEHYLPRFAGDVLPESTAGRVVSLADKLDSIVSTFSRGLIPTGSQDPFALRRQALGMVNILINAQINLSLGKIFAKAMDLLVITQAERREKLATDLADFFRLRLKNVFTDENMRYDLIDAVLAIGCDNIVDTRLKAKALNAGTVDLELGRVIQGLTRVGNLAKNATTAEIDPAVFTTEIEEKLYQAYKNAHTQIEALTKERNYGGVLKAIAGLTEPIDAFFVEVMVMADDIAVRNNRLALLKAISDLTADFADLTKIVA
ncbi:MAG: Glycyl-tRNA synthetase beta subunit [Firmicutes bacterium]|nr:Glycyl-tRNA synthetase beta subunit [Bacillota bacterium]